MGGTLVTLATQELDGPGRRYTVEEIETAYQLWRIPAGRNLTEVARRLNLPRQTVARWRDDHGWIERANKEAAETVASLPEAIGALVATETVRCIETVIQIRDNPDASPKDRLSAAFWLAGIGGVGPVSRIEHAVKPKTPGDDGPVSPADIGQLPPDRLAAMEADYRTRKRQD